MSVQDAITKCKIYWNAVENKVWTQVGKADVERTDFFEARADAKETLEKMKPKDAAFLVWSALPAESRANVRWYGDSIDQVANLVSCFLNKEGYIEFKRLCKESRS